MNLFPTRSLLASALILCLYASTALAQNTGQQAFIVKKTATWCSNCGSWGWTWFKDLIQATEGQGGIPIALHSTSSQLKPPADLDGAILGAFNTTGSFPAFFVNGIQYPTYAATLSAAQAAITQQPVATLSLQTGYDADAISARAVVSWAKDGEGQYAVGLYVVEDSLVFQQSAQGANAIHRYVLRNALGGLPFGDLQSVIHASGQTTVKELTAAYPGISVVRHHILAVLWKQVNGKYQFVNAAMTRLEAGGITSAVDQAEIWDDLTVFPNPVLPGGRVQVESSVTAGPFSWRLIGLQGNAMASGREEGPNWEVSVPAPVRSGSLILEVSSRKGKAVRTLQVR